VAGGQNAAAITMLADGDGSWTRALGLAKETGAFGGVRAQRFALIANDGVVEQLFVEAPASSRCRMPRACWRRCERLIGV
jgi:peroxiredoxin